MNRVLEGLGEFAAKRHWWIIIGWFLILGALVGASHVWGGAYVNNYTVPGSGSQDGLNLLDSSWPQQGGYGGQIVFQARTGTVAADETAVNAVDRQRGQTAARHQGGQPVRFSPVGRGLQGRHDRVRQRVVEHQPGLP